jgi:8-oxo-dGTP diphosphatase
VSRPIRCAALVPAPVASIRRALRDPQVWTRTFRMVGYRALGPQPRTLGPRRFVSDLRFSRDTAALTDVELPGDPQGLPTFALRLGRLTRASGRVTASPTNAGVLVTLDFSVSGPEGLALLTRRRMVRFATTLLGVVTVTARDPQVVVAGAVLRDGKVLAARRARPPELAGLWEMPGGRVEPGETERDALVRELREELAIDVRVRHRIGTPATVGEGLQLHPWAVDWVAGEPVPSEADPAHDEVRWLGPEELAGIAWLPGDLPFVEAIRDLLA